MIDGNQVPIIGARSGILVKQRLLFRGCFPITKVPDIIERVRGTIHKIEGVLRNFLPADHGLRWGQINVKAVLDA